jgi:hypothetical protein
LLGQGKTVVVASELASGYAVIDLVVGRTLLEVKLAVEPAAEDAAVWLRQMLGYVLLDRHGTCGWSGQLRPSALGRLRGDFGELLADELDGYPAWHLREALPPSLTRRSGDRHSDHRSVQPRPRWSVRQATADRPSSCRVRAAGWFLGDAGRGRAAAAGDVLVGRLQPVPEIPASDRGCAGRQPPIVDLVDGAGGRTAAGTGMRRSPDCRLRNAARETGVTDAPPEHGQTAVWSRDRINSGNRIGSRDGVPNLHGDSTPR